MNYLYCSKKITSNNIYHIFYKMIQTYSYCTSSEISQAITYLHKLVWETSIVSKSFSQVIWLITFKSLNDAFFLGIFLVKFHKQFFNYMDTSVKKSGQVQIYKSSFWISKSLFFLTILSKKIVIYFFKQSFHI